MSVFILCAVIANALGTTQASAPAAPRVADNPRYTELRTSGFQSLYNLDYAAARQSFQAIAREFPDHPAGAQFLAAALTVETLNRSRRLQTSLYNDESFYAEDEDKPDPALVREFRLLTKQAETLASARLRANAKDAEAHYFLGAARALRAAFGVAVERRFTAALGDGRAAVDAHRDCLKIDPTFTDAELTVGLYDYVIGDLPLVLKAGASLVGFRGSKKRGLATLERVADKGKWAGDDARILLVALYRRENRPAEAARLARQVAARYPRNHLFQLELADALVAQAAVERSRANINAPQTVAVQTDAAQTIEREAFAIFNQLIALEPDARTAKRRSDDAIASKAKTNRNADKKVDDKSDQTGLPFDLLHFKYADALRVAGRGGDAAEEYRRATQAVTAEPNLVTLAHLRRAQIFDLAGKRNLALAEYEVVLKRPNVFDAHKQAARGMKQPYAENRGT